MRELVLAALILLVASCTTPTPQEASDVATIRGAPALETESTLPTNPIPPTQPPSETTTPFTGTLLAGSATPYLAFTQADYETALKTKRIIVLDFYANWCPVCKREEPNVFAAFERLNDSTIIGFRVNYKDSETDSNEEALARQFGVAYQHTKIILIDGNQALKNPESWDTERWINEINRVARG